MGAPTELLRPWKLATFAIGIGLLVVGSFYYEAPDWDIPISFIMALMAYLTAAGSMHVMLERRWRRTARGCSRDTTHGLGRVKPGWAKRRSANVAEHKR